jgi:hypothetical protein
LTVVLFRISLIVLPLWLDTGGLLMPGTAGLLHVNVVPATDPVILYVCGILLQTPPVATLVTTGRGFTFTVIVKFEPAQEPVVDVGVTIYSTLPAVVLLGLLSTWLMDVPDPAEAPVIPPVIAPTVHVKLLAVDEVRLIPVFEPLHVVLTEGLVTTGLGFTVTVIVNGAPAQFPVTDVGVMIY